jgi:hypothetical protein
MYALWFNIGLLTGGSSVGATVTPDRYIDYTYRLGYNYMGRKKPDEKDEEPEAEISPKFEAKWVGKAPNEILTVSLPEKAAKPRTIGFSDELGKIERSSLNAKRTKADKHRQRQLADDEWLMLNS